MPGFSKTTRLDPKISEDLKRFPEHFDVPVSGCEALNTTSSPIPSFEKSDFSGKVSIRFSHRFHDEFTYFWKSVLVKALIAHFLNHQGVRNRSVYVSVSWSEIEVEAHAKDLQDSA